MVILELRFSDDPTRLDHRPAHREVLRRLYDEGTVVMCGPLADETGAVLIFDTDQAGMDAIIAADPYYDLPSVTVVDRRDWEPILPPR